MSILGNFVAGLFPMTDKSDLLARVTAIIEELEEIVIPSYKNYNSVFSKTKFSSQLAKNVDNLTRDFIQSKDPFGVIVEKCLTEGVANLKIMRQYIQKDRADVFSKDAMRYKTASVMKFIEVAAFTSVYARKVLNYIVIVETLEAKGEMSLLKNELPPAEIDYINGNLGNFAMGLKALSNDHTENQRTLENSRELIVTGNAEEDDSTEAAADRKDVDPLKLGFISLGWNPFWHIGKAWISYQSSRYHAALDERELLEVRLLNYKNYLATKGSDARIEARCREAQARVTSLNKKIADMEKSWKK